MGEPISIKELIYNIVSLSGLSVKDEENPEGDIEIKITGLRPGEKLYEELLLGDNPQETDHEKIQKANDPFIPLSQLDNHLNVLSSLITNNSVLEVKNILKKILISYSPDNNIVDHIFNEKNNI